MVNLLLSPEKDLARSHVVKTIYDPACGTGGMLSVSEKYIRDLNRDAQPKLFGQDWNDEAWAVCKSDMLIKGEDADAIILGDTFTKDGFDRTGDGKKWTFDYMLANPPFGVEWKQQQRYIENEHDTLGFSGRFGAGTPRVNDGALLFLQHMLAKMRAPQDGGSRLAIVFNGSPLFTGDAGGGESEIRRWIIENDWLEAIVALPEQLFYNTGISTYLWVLTNRKEKPRKGKVQLIDARPFWVQMEKSLGNKRRRIGDPSDKEKDPDHIGELTQIFGDFRDGQMRSFTEEDAITHQPVQRQRVVSKIFDNDDFGYNKITVERPLRLNFQASAERIKRLDDESGFKNLASSARKDPAVRQQEIEAGQQRQEQIRELLRAFGKATKQEVFKDRKEFLSGLRKLDRERDVRLSAPELKAVVAAIGERSETAEICLDRDGQPEPDADLRDTETVPLKESIDEYFKREVLPHVSDAWIDTTKTKVGYEIPLNRHFYRYEPPRPLEVIETEIKRLEDDIMKMLKEVTA
jgi:type I restriction enzyme M protein